MLRKILLLAFTFALLTNTALAAAAEYIYKGDSTNPEDILFTYTYNKFYLGEGTKQEPILTHGANAVYLGDKTREYLWRMNDGKLHKDSAFARTDVVASLINDKVYEGYVLNAEQAEELTPLFTIVDNKIYRGDSIEPEDCLLTYSGTLSREKLVFLAYEFTQTKYQIQLNARK